MIFPNSIMIKGEVCDITTNVLHWIAFLSSSTIAKARADLIWQEAFFNVPIQPRGDILQ